MGGGPAVGSWLGSALPLGFLGPQGSRGVSVYVLGSTHRCPVYSVAVTGCAPHVSRESVAAGHPRLFDGLEVPLPNPTTISMAIFGSRLFLLMTGVHHGELEAAVP